MNVMKRLLFVAALLAVSFACIDAQTITQADKDRAAGLVKQMTLKEKINFLGGAIDGFHTLPIPRLGIPAVRMSDGPQGVRNKTKSTLYPCGIAAAASWNRNAVYGMGEGIGQDAKARGVGIMLGPGVNIYRYALNGRNFEYFGEDPFLASETAVSYIKGVQSEGVISTVKHFALNNSEFNRHSLSSNADERTINEIYFPAFRAAVEKAHVGAVMTSYNLINGVHAPEDPWLIKGNLRKWGFDGMVMSDWGSTYSVLGCINGGLDLEMPHAYVMNYDLIKPLLDNGVVTESQIDEKVCHILQTLIAFGFLDKDAKDATIPEDCESSRQFSYDLALEAPVLLKNDGVLPLKQGRRNKIVVLGPDACNVPIGGGSGAVHPYPSRMISLFKGMESLGKKYPVQPLYPVKDNDYDTPQNVKAIENASAVVVAVGFDKDTEQEALDRTYSLPEGQDSLINFVAGHNDHVVVVVYSGGEVDLSKWGDKVSAIMMAWYPGQTGGLAIADLLSGRVSPSGKLPFTFWGSEKKNPVSESYYAKQEVKSDRETYKIYAYTEYTEGIFVGYRGVEHFGIKPLYPFGYGLSYTAFGYSDPDVEPSGDGFDVSFNIKNEGKYDGSETAQVYVSPVNPGIIRPAKELKGYDKVKIAKGGNASVKIHLPRQAFAYYDVNSHGWKVDPGKYRILVGSSSENIKLQVEVDL